MKKKKTKITFTQKEYDESRQKSYEQGKRDGETEFKRKFHTLFGLDVCADIEEASYEDEDDEEEE